MTLIFEKVKNVVEMSKNVMKEYFQWQNLEEISFGGKEIE